MPIRPLIFRHNDDGEQHALGNESDLQQEVYSWQMREDPFGGVAAIRAARIRLHELLVDRFEASQPPSKRRIEALGEFLEEAHRVIHAGQAEWTVSQEPPVDDDDVPYRLNPLLALSLHVEWLVSAFGRQPRAYRYQFDEHL